MNLEKYFSDKNLKKTKTIAGVYFEQKITPDLLSFASQCILEFIGGNTSKSFSDAEQMTAKILLDLNIMSKVSAYLAFDQTINSIIIFKNY